MLCQLFKYVIRSFCLCSRSWERYLYTWSKNDVISERRQSENIIAL